MLRTSFTLIEKTALTHDVYELIYHCPDLAQEPPKPGQYVMFQLASGLNRAYSIASYHPENDTFTLIIKRIIDGKGSPSICDAEPETVFSGMIPLGHFTLRETPVNKCFIGTGTGFAPVYFQAKETVERSLSEKVAFIFGVRHKNDSFYTTEMQALQKKHPNFSYHAYFSQEHQLSEAHECTGYVTDWITPENIAPYQEFYICGSPAMVKDAKDRLDALGVQKEHIFFEQY